GLGFRFLRHVERTRLLLHLVTVSDAPDSDPFSDYLAIRRELEIFSPELAARTELIAVTKADLPDVRDAFAALQQRFQTELGKPVRLISAATHEGVAELLQVVAAELRAGSQTPSE
ncbi:MAG TPA: GTPase ObgE, partial [Polyangiaceae bacterium]|nr:GTPase ObgE [Polyangiaceae bacterium]